MIVRQPPSGIRVSMSASEGSDEGPHNVNQLGDELIELGEICFWRCTLRNPSAQPGGQGNEAAEGARGSEVASACFP